MNIQKFNESYNESIKLIERANDICKELTENYARMNQLGLALSLLAKVDFGTSAFAQGMTLQMYLDEGLKQ